MGRRFFSKIVIIDLKYQLWFGLEVAFIGFVFWVIALLLFFNPYTDFLLENEESAGWVLDALLRIIQIKWPLLAIAFALTWAVGTVMAHRIVGPMVRVRTVLESWKSGDYKPRFRFRKYDYIVPIMDPLNQLLDNQEEVMNQAQNLVEEIQKTSGDPAILEKTKKLLGILYKK